jgi:hypothetical protein
LTILWEKLPLTHKESREWVRIVMNRLKKLPQDYNLKLFLLFEETLEKNVRPIRLESNTRKKKRVGLFGSYSVRQRRHAHI